MQECKVLELHQGMKNAEPAHTKQGITEMDNEDAKDEGEARRNKHDRNALGRTEKKEACYISMSEWRRAATTSRRNTNNET